MRPKPLIVIALSTVAMIAAIPSRAQDANSVKSFLMSVYQHYEHGGSGIDFQGPHANLYFDSSLLALEKADVQANGPGYAPAIDWDPICGCQDWDGIWNLNLDIHIESPKRADANVIFALFDPKQRPTDETSKLKITLAKENGGWRIWDVLDESNPKFASSMRTLLQNDLASLRRKSAPGSH
jgi:hypothetical protein